MFAQPAAHRARPVRAPYKRFSPSRAAAGNRIDRSGPSVVHLKSTWRDQYSVQKTANGTFVGDYIANAHKNLQGYDLPMGAELQPQDPDTGEWMLQLPALEFLDVYIRYALRPAGRHLDICRSSWIAIVRRC
jgi:hypothetical protein